MLSTQALEDAASEIRGRIAQTQAGLMQLREVLERDQRELSLVVELLKLHGDQANGHSVAVEESAAGRLGGQDEHPVLQAAKEVLRDAGRPLHIQELTAAIRERGVTIPGKGEIANVIAVIRNNGDISRPQRGIYALSGWGPSTVSKLRPARAKARRRRRRSPIRIARHQTEGREK